MADDVTADLRVSPRLTIPGDELQWRFARSGGAGGQHVNTSDSAVELRWNAARSTALGATLGRRLLDRLAAELVDGHVVVNASTRRSQLRNRETARQRLAAIVAEAITPPPPPRRPTRPSRAARQRRIDDKKRRSETKRHRQRPDD